MLTNPSGLNFGLCGVLANQFF